MSKAVVFFAEGTEECEVKLQCFLTESRLTPRTT